MLVIGRTGEFRYNDNQSLKPVNVRMARISLPGFDLDPDETDRPAVASRLQVAEHDGSRFPAKSRPDLAGHDLPEAAQPDLPPSGRLTAVHKATIRQAGAFRNDD